MKLLPLMLVAAPVAVNARARKFFMKLDVVSMSNMPDVDGGFPATGEVGGGICYAEGSEVTIRAEIGGRGQLAEAKPGFSEGILGNQKLDVNWQTNIVTVNLGDEVRVSAVDYQDPTDVPPGGQSCFHPDQLQYCQTTETDCTDTNSRQELCKVLYAGCIDESGVDGCESQVGGVTAKQCFDSGGSCRTAQAAITNVDVSTSELPDVSKRPYTSRCWARFRQPMGFGAFELPPDKNDGSGVSWEVVDYGDRTQWGEEKTISYTSVKRRSDSPLAALSSSASSEVKYRVQLWASQCSDGEYIDQSGFCQRCQAGYECLDGVTQKACGTGTFQKNAGSKEPCKYCPVDTFQTERAALLCEPCESGFISDEGSSTACIKEIKCQSYEKVLEPRVGTKQAVCGELKGAALTAAKIGMSTGGFVTFILFIIILCICIVLFVLRWMRQRQRLAREREAQLAREKGDLQSQMQATENLAINPLMQTQMAKPKAKKARTKDDPEMRALLRDMQKENAELRAEIRRYKMADQQSQVGGGKRRNDHKQTRREFGQTQS